MRADTVAAVVNPTSEPARITPVDSSKDAEPGDFVQVATGENHWCGLRGDGKAICRGPNDQGQLNVLEGARFRQLSLGWGFSCGLQTDGQISCWGRNNHQQASPPDGRFTSIDAGWDHACALSGPTATCWGRNADDRATPPAGVAFTAIGAGAEHSCGLTSVGDLICWGKNDNGRADSREGPFRALAVGIAHTCVLHSDGKALCQGDNAVGQSKPPATAFVRISAGSDHTCGTLATGHVECWGGKAPETANARIGPPGRFRSVSGGWTKTCAITRDSRIACWSLDQPQPLPSPFASLYLEQASHRFPNDVIPTEVLPWPNGGLAVAYKTGTIEVITPDGSRTQILNMSDIVISENQEQGLLSVAVDPRYPASKYIYIYYTMRDGQLHKEHFARLSRLPIIDGIPARNRELAILDVTRDKEDTGAIPKVNHYGGAIRFGSDGMLYLGIGDASCFECPQSLESLHGKIIRINVREASVHVPYTIPEDNPIRDSPEARPEIWSYGLRNPWRMSFDTHNEELWVGDVGQITQEEVSIATPGANLGWPILEGFDCLTVSPSLNETYGSMDLKPCNEGEAFKAQFTEPVFSYERSPEPTNDPQDFKCSIVGGIVYRGSSIPRLQGTYIFADYCSGQVWALNGTAESGWRAIEIVNLDTLITSLAPDADGELLIVSTRGLYRLLAVEVSFAPGVTHVPTFKV